MYFFYFTKSKNLALVVPFHTLKSFSFPYKYTPFRILYNSLTPTRCTFYIEYTQFSTTRVARHVHVSHHSRESFALPFTNIFVYVINIISQYSFLISILLFRTYTYYLYNTYLNISLAFSHFYY
jgi:hypothetical protein